jgi:hypothetical protein
VDDDPSRTGVPSAGAPAQAEEALRESERTVELERQAQRLLAEL